MHSGRLEPTKLILIGTRTTYYQATGDDRQRCATLVISTHAYRGKKILLLTAAAAAVDAAVESNDLKHRRCYQTDLNTFVRQAVATRTMHSIIFRLHVHIKCLKVKPIIYKVPGDLYIRDRRSPVLGTNYIKQWLVTLMLSIIT